MVVGLEFENEVTNMPNICQNTFPDGLNRDIYFFKETTGEDAYLSSIWWNNYITFEVTENNSHCNILNIFNNTKILNLLATKNPK